MKRSRTLNRTGRVTEAFLYYRRFCRVVKPKMHGPNVIETENGGDARDMDDPGDTAGEE